MKQLLGIYLNDQLAMGVLWRDMARRAQRKTLEPFRQRAGTEALS